MMLGTFLTFLTFLTRKPCLPALGSDPWQRLEISSCLRRGTLRRQAFGPDGDGPGDSCPDAQRQRLGFGATGACAGFVGGRDMSRPPTIALGSSRPIPRRDLSRVETVSGTLGLSTAADTVYRRHNKPALGPVGDSLDDLK